MNNVFITQYFDWNTAPGWKLRAVNALLRKLGVEARLQSPRGTGEQTNVEQRMNLFHLLSQVLAFGVPGDAVEVGTHQGSSAVLMERVIAHMAPDRRVHVYDAFVKSGPDAVVANFERLQLRPPVIHAGWLRETLPAQLPEKICFAHLDVGWGQPAEALQSTVSLCLESVYDRLSKNGVLLLADYCEPDVYERNGHQFPHAITNRSLWNLYPPVKRACDEFFAEKPESMNVLYSGHYSHGYFRKT